MTENLTARIDQAPSPCLPIFELIQKKGNIPERDMYNTFNMGIGLVIAIPKDQVGHALDVLALAGEQSYVIGDGRKGDARGAGVRAGAWVRIAVLVSGGAPTSRH